MTRQRRPSALLPASRSKIYHDPAVRRALDGLLKAPLTLDAMRSNLARRFGVARTPSRSAVGRYVRAARLARGINFLRIT